MTTHRFFIMPNQIRGQQVFLTGEQARQIHSVLRLGRGDSILVLDNQGWLYAVEIWTAARDQVVGQILSKQIAAGEPATHLTLYQSTLKGDKFDWVLQKGTELGVRTFVPMITQRSIIREEKIKPNKKKRWQRIITEAAEQCRRGRIPTIEQPLPFSGVLASLQNHDYAIISWEAEDQRDISAVVAEISPKPAKIAVLIGPEGGFTEEEFADAAQAGVKPVTLGPRILRSETAAIVAAALILGHLGDLKPG